MSHTSADHQLLPPDVGRMTIVEYPSGPVEMLLMEIYWKISTSRDFSAAQSNL